MFRSRVLPMLMVIVCLTAFAVDAQTVTVSKTQWDQLNTKVNTQANKISTLEISLKALRDKVDKLPQADMTRINAVEKQVETHRVTINSALAHDREADCRYAEAITLLATRPSQLSTDPLTAGCPDKTKPAKKPPNDIPKG